MALCPIPPHSVCTLNFRKYLSFFHKNDIVRELFRKQPVIVALVIIIPHAILRTAGWLFSFAPAPIAKLLHKGKICASAPTSENDRKPT